MVVDLLNKSRVSAYRGRRCCASVRVTPRITRSEVGRGAVQASKALYFYYGTSTRTC